jgi:hypothetical protein
VRLVREVARSFWSARLAMIGRPERVVQLTTFGLSWVQPLPAAIAAPRREHGEDRQEERAAHAGN